MKLQKVRKIEKEERSKCFSYILQREVYTNEFDQSKEIKNWRCDTCNWQGVVIDDFRGKEEIYLA